MSSVLCEIKHHIATITLNRPDTLNSFNYAMIKQLGQLIADITTNKQVRIVIITGAGDKSFSVGADLKERKNLSEEEVRRNIYQIGDVFSKIADLPQPTIAAINGYALGGGMELALACDFRIASSAVIMGLTETSLAIIPGAGGTQRLPRIIGEAKALELILTSKKQTSEEAYSHGLLTKVVEPHLLMKTCQELAETMLKNGPIALQQAKFAIKQGMNTDLHTGLQIEKKAYEVTIPTQDRIEALAAFYEKRKPNYKGV
jgi:enoyl-CoA hydratase